jgi:branched-chain amino acid transport system permease protein
MTSGAFARLQIVALVALALVLLALPWLVSVATLVSLNVFVILGILALSMALVWGSAGIFSFGQSIFFGIGSYGYAVAALSMEGSTVPILIAVVVAGAAAALLGYFMFFGRVGDLYLAVITLTVALLFYQFINSGFGAHLTIGQVQLGGYNGIPGVPPINVPGDPSNQFGFVGMYLVSAGALILLYIAMRALLASPFGQTVIAIRENELRAELVGFDSRAYKLGTFVIGALVAGFGGVLFAAWSGLVSPDVFSLAFGGQIIIWTLAGGVGMLAGPIIGCFLIQALTTWLGTKQITDTNIVLGVIFILFVLFIPSGLLPTVRALLVRDHARP